MSDQTVAAESSAAEVTDPFNGLQPTFDEISSYNRTKELPERFKPADIADPAPAEPAELPDNAPAAEPEQQQEKGKGKPSKEESIAQLEKALERLRGPKPAERKTEVAAVTEPKEQPKAPQTYADWKQGFEPENWIAEYAKAHPEASYERANAAMFDHMIDVRDQFKAIEQQRESQLKELNAKVATARNKYGDKFDEVLWPTLNTLMTDPQVNPAVRAMLGDSEVTEELLYAIGSDEKTLNEFLAMAKNSPGKALREIARLETGIISELEKPDTPRDASGKFVAATPPAKPKTSAPKPPEPVSGVSTGAFDTSDESLSAEDWARKRNEALAKRG